MYSLLNIQLAPAALGGSWRTQVRGKHAPGEESGCLCEEFQMPDISVHVQAAQSGCTTLWGTHGGTDRHTALAARYARSEDGTRERDADASGLVGSGEQLLGRAYGTILQLSQGALQQGSGRQAAPRLQPRRPPASRILLQDAISQRVKEMLQCC